MSVRTSPFLYKMVRRAGKSIAQMLLRGHQVTAGELQPSNLRVCTAGSSVAKFVYRAREDQEESNSSVS